MTSFIEANFPANFDESGLPKIKRDVEFTFDWIPKILAFASKIYLFPVTSNMFTFRNQFFCFKNSAHGQKFVVKLATRKVHWITVVVEMVVEVIKHPQSRKPSLQWCLWYCINVFVQMIKIFFNWLMRLVDWFHWHFCIVVRLQALTSLSRISKNQPFAPTWF